MLESFKTKEEEERRAKLQEEEKWQELNADLAGEIESYKPLRRDGKQWIKDFVKVL